MPDTNQIVDKIVEYEDNLEEEVKGWKSKLSGGLDNTQVFASLIILGCFYAIYSIVNSTLGNSRDQYTITSGCYCRKMARILYILLFSFLLFIWFTVHTYAFLEQNLKKSPKKSCLHKSGKEMEALRKQFCLCYCCNKKNVEHYCCIKKNDEQYCCCYKNVIERYCCYKNVEPNFKHYQRILWYRYYKLYVVGYTKEIKPEKISDPTEDSNLDCKCQWPISADGCQCWFLYKVKVVRVVLIILKYIAQGLTVPLLMLQVFDTYALLCFSPNGQYCSDASEYKIHVAQAAITISFLLSIGLAQLTTALLEWNPVNSERIEYCQTHPQQSGSE